MFRAICKLLFIHLLGWKIEGNPPQQDKYISVVAPHTSNWDFPVGVAVRSITRMKSVYLGKASLFKPPFGWFFKWLGGYPVERSKNTNLVDAVVAEFNKHEQFAVAIAPEGTRKKVEKWKTGFYYMALKANVPIIRVGIDFQYRKVIFDEPLFVTGNIEKELPEIQSFFNHIRGKH